ncbi:MAG: L-seryl-tRNA(Sec) selenium transferase [Pseudomonadota bacterium]
MKENKEIDLNSRMRTLPSVQRLLETPDAKTLVEEFSHSEVTDALRDLIAVSRAALASGKDPVDFESKQFPDLVSNYIQRNRQPNLMRTINASGILVHTNLGRAPLAPEAMAAISDIAQGYSNLEFDLDAGARGSRHEHTAELLADLTGADDAIVVNNCAAAVVLCLSALATDKEVIVSRGELIEIGGSFRLPDVIAQSGARLKEVGATNKTHLRDYELAITEDARILMKSHTSNYKIVGFSTAPDRKSLCTLAASQNLIVMEDLGSGVLIDLSPYGLPDEPVVGDILKMGVDLITFSGDKLLGGPQAGIIAGRADLIAAIKTHPLARAVRIDKLSLAALEATLRLYKPPHNPIKDIPVLRMLSEPVEDVRQRAHDLQSALGSGGVSSRVTESTASAGGGSLPAHDIKSAAIVPYLRTTSPHHFANRLRQGEIPVIARISKEELLLDLRTVSERDLKPLANAVIAAMPS